MSMRRTLLYLYSEAKSEHASFDFGTHKKHHKYIEQVTYVVLDLMPLEL